MPNLVKKNPESIAASIKKTRQVAFLTAFAECGTATKACQIAGINSLTERRWRSDKLDTWYAAQFQQALISYRDRIEEEVRSRAIDGVEVPIVGKVQTPLGAEDRIIGTKVVKSDLLLMFHAKRHIPEFRDKYEPPKEEKQQETVSPLTRIVMVLNTMEARQKGEVIEDAEILSLPASTIPEGAGDGKQEGH